MLAPGEGGGEESGRSCGAHTHAARHRRLQCAVFFQAGAREILARELAPRPHASVRAGKPTRRQRLGARAKAAEVRSTVASAPYALGAALPSTERSTAHTARSRAAGRFMLGVLKSLAQLVTFAETGPRPLPAFAGNRIDTFLRGCWCFALPRPAAYVGQDLSHWWGGRPRAGMGNRAHSEKVWKTRR